MKSSDLPKHHPLLHAATMDAAAPADALRQAREFALPLLAHEHLGFGENALHHADGVATILQQLGGADSLQAAAYLVFACEQLAKPLDALTHAFDANYAKLAVDATALMQAQRHAARSEQHSESVRKMLLAFSKDLRVVLLCLASCLQSLRWCAESKQTPDAGFARQAQQIFAPLANRLGIWQIKWELEDLSFRFLEPEVYREIAQNLSMTRIDREATMSRLRQQIQDLLAEAGIAAQVQGRPKHIYSIVKKMRGKNLRFDELMDIRAMRILVPDLEACYAALDVIHRHYQPIAGEFDDYIARPKPNGYQSIHTVVQQVVPQHPHWPVEIQIRTEAMHEAAETGGAAHWAYKEAGAKGYSGVSASSQYDAKIAMLRQLLAWERDISEPTGSDLLADRIYVFTPEAKVIDLSAGATPVDFAYAVHSSLGHRCRGAKIDGVLCPLNTPLHNGQTVEILTAKEGGPSRDWLIDESYLISSRSRAKVRAWFNAQQAEEYQHKGREQIEKLLQREGKTAIKLDELAQQLGLKSAEQMYEAVGKEHISLRQIEQSLKPKTASSKEDESFVLRPHSPAAQPKKGDVLVVGVDSLLTQLAKCCRPAPPDAIVGYVTKGRGVSIHRQNCRSLTTLKEKSPDRIIEVAWGKQAGGSHYSVGLSLLAKERAHLLRDLMDCLSKNKITVSSLQTQPSRGLLHISLTLELGNSSALGDICNQLLQITGVIQARRA